MLDARCMFLKVYRLCDTGQEHNVYNIYMLCSWDRLTFLSSVVGVFSDRMMLCSAASKIAFCNGCVRYVCILYST